MLFSELGNKIADQGYARFPAYTQEDRSRLVDVANRLTRYWGQPVYAEVEDESRVRLCLAGRELVPAHA